MGKKHLILLLLMGMVCFVSCKMGVYSSEGGQADVAYLQFVSDGNAKGETVNVTIDGKTTFKAKVTKDKFSYRKGDLYSIATGKKNIKVEKDGSIIYDKDIFVSTQQTKKIILP